MVGAGLWGFPRRSWGTPSSGSPVIDVDASRPAPDSGHGTDDERLDVVGADIPHLNDLGRAQTSTLPDAPTPTQRYR